MNKTVKKVFLLIGTLVAIFLIWALVFNDGGILRTGYNALAKGINGQWAKVAGSGQKILPEWNEGKAEGQGFDIGTGGTGAGAGEAN